MQLRTLICVSKYTTNVSKSVLIVGVSTKTRRRKWKRPKKRDLGFAYVVIFKNFPIQVFASQFLYP